MVGFCGEGPESCVQKQGKLMVLAVQHFECPGHQVELDSIEVVGERKQDNCISCHDCIITIIILKLLIYGTVSS